jgi:acylphosphatase
MPKYCYIAKAKLTLTLNSANSLFGSGANDSLFASFVTDSVKDLLYGTVLGIPTTDDQKRYVFDITSFVQGWVNNRPNLGMDISAYGEAQAVDLFTLFSERNSDKTKVPKLTIVYFTAPK